MGTPYKNRDAKAVFLSKIEPDTNGGCWLWTAAIGSHGYGVFRLNGRQTTAQRASYELHHGPIPEGRVVMHTCDVRACVNPNHLVAGTVAQNQADMARKGRAVCQKGDLNHTRKLDSVAVKEIRSLLKTGMMLNREIAERFGVSGQHISFIKSGKSWNYPELMA